MSFRYGYTWSYMVRTGGGFDSNGDPIQATETPTTFECDAQTDNGSFSFNIDGDDVKSSYFVSIPLEAELTFKQGDVVIDHNGNERRVVNFIVTALARELWVS